MIEINNQFFKEGDIVHFERAPLPDNRQRDYRIIAVKPNGIAVTASEFNYEFDAATAARIGITNRHHKED